MSGVCQTPLLEKWSPTEVATWGWSRSRNQWATSMKCTIRSVNRPPPKSQNQRQFRKRYSSNGCPSALPRKAFQSTLRGSMFSGFLRTRSVLRFQVRWTL